ncbi:MAG: hypothetical protein ABH811_02560 [archaeon]
MKEGLKIIGVGLLIIVIDFIIEKIMNKGIIIFILTIIRGVTILGEFSKFIRIS